MTYVPHQHSGAELHPSSLPWIGYNAESTYARVDVPSGNKVSTIIIIHAHCPSQYLLLSPIVYVRTLLLIMAPRDHYRLSTMEFPQRGLEVSRVRNALIRVADNTTRCRNTLWLLWGSGVMVSIRVRVRGGMYQVMKCAIWYNQASVAGVAVEIGSFLMFQRTIH